MGNETDSEVIKTWPVEKRLAEFQRSLMALMKTYDVEPIPTLHHVVSAGAMQFIAQITLIDLQNEEMLKKYGRTKLPVADKEPEPTPGNPRLN